MSELEIQMELNDACNRLREVIHNEKLVKDYRDAWRRMSMTSSAQRRMHNGNTGNASYISYKA